MSLLLVTVQTLSAIERLFTLVTRHAGRLSQMVHSYVPVQIASACKYGTALWTSHEGRSRGMSLPLVSVQPSFAVESLLAHVASHSRGLLCVAQANMSILVNSEEHFGQATLAGCFRKPVCIVLIWPHIDEATYWTGG